MRLHVLERRLRLLVCILVRVRVRVRVRLRVRVRVRANPNPYPNPDLLLVEHAHVLVGAEPARPALEQLDAAQVEVLDELDLLQARRPHQRAEAQRLLRTALGLQHG